MTRLIGPANPFIQTEIDVAFDADLTAPAESWTWTNMGDYTDGDHTRPRLLNQTIRVVNGRRDESNLADPGTIDVLLGNGDLALTPRNPSSPYYPGLRQGTPLRVQVQAGLPYLLLTGLTGSRASTPDNAALDITGDIAGAVQFLCPVAVGPFASTYKVLAKWATGQRSYRFLWGDNGTARWRWSADGTNELEAQTSLPVPRPEAGWLTVAWELDVSNGGNNITTWYVGRVTLDELLADKTAYTFGDPWVNSGTTSIHPGTAVLDLGDNTGSGFPAYPGGIGRFQLRSGTLSGTVVANLDNTGLAAGASGTTDSAGRVWSFTGATITDRRPRFCGRVDKVGADWTQVDEANPLMPTIAHVKVSASGVLERLAQGDAIGSALARHVSAPSRRDNLISAWLFEDGSDATQAANVVSGAAPMNVRGDFTFGGDTSYNAVTQQMTVASGENALMTAPIPEIPQVAGVNWQVAKFFRIDEPETSPTATGLMAVSSNGEVAKWLLTINDTQISIAGQNIDGGTVVLDTIPSDSRFFDTEAMIVLEVTDDGANVDWAVTLIPIPLGLQFATSGTYAGNTGIATHYKNSATGPPSGMSQGPVIVTTNQPIGWLAPADTAFVGEPAAQRVHRLCQEYNILAVVDGPYGGAGPTSWKPIVAAGGTPMGPQRPAKLLDLFDECATADHGILGEQRGSLGLFYRSGQSMLGQPTRLSLQRAKPKRQVIDPFEEVDDDLRTVNDVTASRVDGSSYRIEDPQIAAGVVERYQQPVEVNVDSDLRLPSQAGWRYHLGTWPEPRFPQVWTDVAKDADLVEDVLGFGVGDRLEVSDPPPGCPPVDQLADGIVEELERFQWRMGINGHPARPWDTAIVDDDDFGRVDTAGSETSGSFTSGTSTSMSVATTLGTIWTTEINDFPFDIEVAEVRLTVTNITGSSSPQTFTITQTPVNGVAKVIPTGTPVQLWQGAVVAP
jgi:hypothetical protein